ncbi:MAG: hypothetical protein MK212_11945 [Saprospiraceae bacterium]|nr:hypothetical protein [Saprospiraceae bacterium]
MITAIIGAVVAITTAAIQASEGSKNRKTQEELAQYEATKFKQFYQVREGNNTLFIILIVVLVVAFFGLLYLLSKQSKNNES